MTQIQLIARHTMKPGEESTVLAALTKLIETSRTEEGNLAFEAFRSVDDERSYVLLERYASPEALAEHRSSAHFQQYLVEQIAPRLEKREIEEYDVGA